ncbi:winged helix DNA-binding domain-containing protein [Miltoncostaea marina]|uniref:winged helix DNA-binding domain-containing protein n=1 Tax=Miltoncostaea marina TaxID=2843215 RepID=UPI001C3D4D86|nr:winged helix DNA-binding domain-containing protein [Miltoncostaea marina]
MAERILSRRGLNRALLARQGLIERFAASPARAARRVGGIQAQYAPSIYIGLWSRCRGLERAAVTRALDRRRLVQATLLRATIHAVAAEDYWPFAIASRERGRALFLRTRRSLTGDDMRAAAELLRPRLAEGPVTRRGMEELLGRERAAGVGFWVDLVRVPPSGTWERRRADRYGDARAWVGPEPAMTPEQATAHVARRRLAAFGPATAAEVADWAGLPVGPVAAALAGMDLRRLRDEDGRELLDDPRAPLPDPQTPAPPRFLPTWDAVLLVHARRAGILREEDRPRIFSTRTPHSFPTFVVDGTVAGTWRTAGGRVVLDPWRRLAAAEQRALEDEGERLALLVA